MVFCVVLNVNVFVEACCVLRLFTLAIMASVPFFVYRSYWLFTPALLMRFAYSSSHSSRLRQVNKASPRARAGTGMQRTHKYTHIEVLVYLLFA